MYFGRGKSQVIKMVCCTDSDEIHYCEGEFLLRTIYQNYDSLRLVENSIKEMVEVKRKVSR